MIIYIVLEILTPFCVYREYVPSLNSQFTDVLILISPVHYRNRALGNLCCVHFGQIGFAARSRWGKMDLMPTNIKNDIRPLISTIILPKVLFWLEFSILYVKYYYGRGWLLPRKQLGIYGQNAVNVIISLSGLDSTRVNHNTKFCILGLNKKIPHTTLHKHLIF